MFVITETPECLPGLSPSEPWFSENYAVALSVQHGGSGNSAGWLVVVAGGGWCLVISWGFGPSCLGWWLQWFVAPGNRRWSGRCLDRVAVDAPTAP